jgi:membrane protease YdiL (CAAX protease family)
MDIIEKLINIFQRRKVVAVYVVLVLLLTFTYGVDNIASMLPRYLTSLNNYNKFLQPGELRWLDVLFKLLTLPMVLPVFFLLRKLDVSAQGFRKLRPNFVQLTAAILSVLAFRFVIYGTHHFIDSSSFYTLFGKKSYIPFYWAPNVCFFIIAAPVAEELLFRGVVFTAARRLFPVWFAVLLQATFFAMHHMPWYSAVAAFFVGILASLAVLRFQTIWAGICVHSLYNAMGVAQDYFKNSSSDTIFNVAKYSPAVWRIIYPVSIVAFAVCISILILAGKIRPKIQI